MGCSVLFKWIVFQNTVKYRKKNLFQGDVAFCHWLMLSYTHDELTWYTGLFIYFQKSKCLNAVFCYFIHLKKMFIFLFYVSTMWSYTIALNFHLFSYFECILNWSKLLNFSELFLSFCLFCLDKKSNKS